MFRYAQLDMSYGHDMLLAQRDICPRGRPRTEVLGRSLAGGPHRPRGRKMEIEDIKRGCCFTGHRTVEKKELRSEMLDALLRRLITTEGIDTFICGGALGFDTLMAERVLELKEEFPHIRLWLFLPCLEQDLKWSRADKKRYKELLELADYVDCPQIPYNSTVMKTRNYKMVDNALYCIAYYNGKKISGTAQTIRYAKKLGRKIFNSHISAGKGLEEV